MKQLILVALAVLYAGNIALAENEISLPAVGGYDVVAYFDKNMAVKGSGFYTAAHEEQTYLFSTEENKAKFEKQPAAYLPQFGGWCAYGVSLGKKFYVDPTVFEVVDGKLYLNLDSEIQGKWAKDKAAQITLAHEKWEGIREKNPADL